MLNIPEYKEYGGETRIALMDNSSLAFMHELSQRSYPADRILGVYDLILIPKWVMEALIQEGHKIAKELGYTHAIVLGSEKYYPKSGYSPAEGFGINAPFDVSSENFMACVLNETGAEIHGTIKYAPEFGIE